MKAKKEVMGRLRMATVDRQFKEELKHGLKDSEMLMEIIRKLTKGDENIVKLSEHLLTWAKRVEVQRAQAAVINCSHKLKNFDAILQMDKGKQRETKPATPVKMSEEDANTVVRSMN